MTVQLKGFWLHNHGLKYYSWSKYVLYFYPGKLYLTAVFLTLYHTAPSSPPANFTGHNLGSRRIKLSWVKGPKSLPFDIIGFHLACIRLHLTEEYSTNLSHVQLKWVFKGLRKFTNYSCRLRAYNRFGNGTWSKELVISTDEDGMSQLIKTFTVTFLSETFKRLRLKTYCLPACDKLCFSA